MTGNGRVSYEFGNFVLDTGQGVLLHKGVPVRLAPKTLEILAYMLERPSQVISKDDLMEAVWPDSFVEESNLVVHISALRKIIAIDPESVVFIETFPKKGYRLQTAVKIGSVLTGAKAIGSKNGSEPDKADIVEGVTRSSSRWLIIAAMVLIGGIAISSIAAFVVYKLRDPLSGYKNMTAERITNVGTVMTVSITPDGGYILYSRYTGNEFSLWLRAVDSRSEIQIHPPTKAGFSGLTITPDGRSIIYGASYEDVSPGGYIMPLFGGSRTKLQFTNAPWRLSVSPDGQLLAYVKRDQSLGQTYIIVTRADGSEPRTIATRQEPNSFLIQQPAWSPDGRKLATIVQNANESTPRVIDINVESGEEKTITRQNWTTMVGLLWLPDMSGLLISAAEETASNRQIWHISYSDGLATRLTNTTVNYSYISASSDFSRIAAVEAKWASSMWSCPVFTDKDGPTIDIGNAVKISSNQVDGWDQPEWYPTPVSWTLDGRIIFISEESGNTDIWSMNADGNSRIQLTTDRLSNTSPAISPDGTTIAFMSRRTGKSSLWLMDIDGSNQRRLTDSVMEKHPAFSPDGNWIYYTSLETGKTTIWRIPANGGDAVQVVSETSSRPSVSPDGNWLLFEIPGGFGMLDLKDGSSIRYFKRNEPVHLPLWLPNSKAFTFLRSEKAVMNLWLQPLDSEEPSQLLNFDSEWIGSYGWSPDGKTLVFSRQTKMRDVTLLTVPK